MDKKTIAKSQIYLGVILLVATVLHSFYFYNSIYLEGLKFGSESVGDGWGEATENNGQDAASLAPGAHVTDTMVILGSVYRLSLHLYIVLIVLLLAVSAMLILQGKNNLKKK